MEHSLHLAAKHFVQNIAPGFASTTEQPNNGGDDSEDEEFVSGDSLGKANALVKQVCPFLALPICF
jgi:hypothetical protein